MKKYGPGKTYGTKYWEIGNEPTSPTKGSKNATGGAMVGVYRARVEEIAPDGKPDGSFGNGGSTKLTLGPGEPFLSSMTVDGQGRVLVGGVTGTRKARSIVVLRLSATGRRQMNFGPMGEVTTRVQGLNGPSALFFDRQGRLVTVDQYSNALKGRGGLVVARYLLSN